MANNKNYKYLGLSKRYFKSYMREFVDQDYIRNLSDEDKQWLSEFNLEYYNGEIDKETGLHNTNEARRECYQRKNKADADIISNVYVHILPIEWYIEQDIDGNSIEAVELLIDLTNILKRNGVTKLTTHALKKAYKQYKQE